MIEIVSLSKYYNKSYAALFEVDFSVTSGKSTVIFGPDGSGKTTLLDIVAGLKEYEGSVKVNKTERRDVALNTYKISYIKEKPILFYNKSVAYNLKYYFKVYSQSTQKYEVENKIQNIAKLFGLSHLLNKKVRKLSGSETFFVALARSYLKKPELLLIDLGSKFCKNEQFVAELLKLLSLFKRKCNSTILIATDSSQFAMRLDMPIYYLFFGTMNPPKAIKNVANNPLNLYLFREFAKPVYEQIFDSTLEKSNVVFTSGQTSFSIQKKHFKNIPVFIELNANSCVVAAKKKIESLDLNYTAASKVEFFIFDKLTGIRLL